MRRNSRLAALTGLLVSSSSSGRPSPRKGSSGRPSTRSSSARPQDDGRAGRRPGGGLAWTPDGKGSYAFEDGTFKRTDILTGEKTPLFDDAKLLAAVNAMTGRQEVKLFFNRFQYLDDGKKIQFQAFNKVFIYDLASSKLAATSRSGPSPASAAGPTATSSRPTSSIRAFTRNYNLYVKDMDGNETALTTDGTEDLRNGYPDWVYPEELGPVPGLLVVARLEEDRLHAVRREPGGQVPHRPRRRPHAPLRAPGLSRCRARTTPSSGCSSSTSRRRSSSAWRRATTSTSTSTRGKWTNDGREFTYHRLNRLQNKVELFAADPATGKTRLFLTDTTPATSTNRPISSSSRTTCASSGPRSGAAGARSTSTTWPRGSSSSS